MHSAKCSFASFFVKLLQNFCKYKRPIFHRFHFWDLIYLDKSKTRKSKQPIEKQFRIALVTKPKETIKITVEQHSCAMYVCISQGQLNSHTVVLQVFLLSFCKTFENTKDQFSIGFSFGI